MHARALTSALPQPCTRRRSLGFAASSPSLQARTPLFLPPLHPLQALCERPLVPHKARYASQGRGAGGNGWVVQAETDHIEKFTGSLV